jgi:hypothetical protein
MAIKIHSIKYDSEVVWLPIWKDKDGGFIQTKAKTLFPKPRIEAVSIGVIRARVTNSNYTEATWYAQQDTTNSGTWRSFPADTAWASRITFDPDSKLVEYVIRICKLGWKSVFPECGYVYKSGTKHMSFTDDDDRVYLGFLNSDGDKLEVGETPLLSEVNFKGQISFSTFGF